MVRPRPKLAASPILTLPVRHLLSAERMPFTATYFGSIALTLYFALGVRLAYPCPLLRCPFPAAHGPAHPPLLHRPARLPPLVSGELLPHGLVGAAPGRALWHQPGHIVDDRIAHDASFAHAFRDRSNKPEHARASQNKARAMQRATYAAVRVNIGTLSCALELPFHLPTAPKLAHEEHYTR